MPREFHGTLPSLTRLNWAAVRVDHTNQQANFPYDIAVSQDATPFDYMFPELQQPEMLLPDSVALPNGRRAIDMRCALIRLGATMGESAEYRPPDSLIPSAYTYLGQFIDHDIDHTSPSDQPIDITIPKSDQDLTPG